MEKKNKILVVDDSKVILMVLKKYLTKQGYDVVTIDSAIEGAEILKKEFIPLVITDINMPDITGLDFLLWIKKHSPLTKVIVMTAFGSDEAKEFVIKNGGINYFEKSSNYAQLDDIIYETLSRKNYQGKIKEITLFDFFQLIILSGKNKVISIEDQKTNKTGRVFFKSGKMIHAVYDGLEGQDALYNIMKITSGIFIDENWKEPEAVTINLPYEFLIMSIAQKMDEEKGNIKDQIIKELEEDSNKEILIVDDEPSVLKIMQMYLTKNGFPVTTTDSAEKGMEFLKIKHFDLVITDVNMPGVSGLDFLSWIRENAPKSKVIMMTGTIEDDTRIFANKYGAINYFEKPINLKELDFYIKDIFSDNTFSGNVTDVNLFDFVQVLSLSRKNKLLVVTNPIVEQTGYLFLKEGSVVHATFGEYQGEDAFYHIAKIKDMIFAEGIWHDPEQITINISLSNLLMKAFRLMEEEKEKSNDQSNNKVEIKSSLGTIVTADLNYLERALEEREARDKANIQKYQIDETGEFAGIIIGKSIKSDVIKNMVQFNMAHNIVKSMENSLVYDEITLNITFSEDNIVEEINFGSLFKGTTKKGLKVGDKIDKAIEMYGEPRFGSEEYAVWEKLSVFSKSNSIINSLNLGTI
ncbi:MAG: response regulator [Candidatus Sericytochromatia bacterium]|nr:response regulator [Candidatus Sericytochromatia bacterium]